MAMSPTERSRLCRERKRAGGIPEKVAGTKRLPDLSVVGRDRPVKRDLAVEVDALKVQVALLKGMESRLQALEDRPVGELRFGPPEKADVVAELRQRLGVSPPVAGPKYVAGAKVRDCCRSTALEPHTQECELVGAP